MDLNVMGDPLVLYCRQSPDYLPQPEACKVTGITPQLANDQGVCEAQFIQQILNQIGFPGTCSVGYNNIRFDDEFTRHTLFRNLRDPYEQEWKEGNSRWDLLDIVRLTRALRPDGIQWPFNEDGTASNRLEHLSQINGIEHTQAHDAMSDVWATIGMARLIRQAQPKLFNYAFAQRGKASVSKMLNVRDRTPCLQVSGMIPGARHHLSAIMPLIRHPQNSNGVIVLDLSQDPRTLATLDADEIEARLYQSADSHNHTGTPRPGLRTVQINKCPVLVPLATLRDTDAQRLGIDQISLKQHAAYATAMINDSLLDRIGQAMSRHWDSDQLMDVDGTLYGGEFLSQADKQRLQSLLKLPPEQLSKHSGQFDDKRLDELLWRYQARSYPNTLDAEQRAHWRDHCLDRLSNPSGPWLSFQTYQQVIDDTQWQPDEQALKQALSDYGQELHNALTP